MDEKNINDLEIISNLFYLMEHDAEKYPEIIARLEFAKLPLERLVTAAQGQNLRGKAA